MKIDQAKINELDRAEWFDVCRRLKPGLTEDEYAGMWERFQAAKAAKELH